MSCRGVCTSAGRLVELRGSVLVAEPQGDLGFEELRADVLSFGPPGREVLGGHSEPLRKLVKYLERRDARPGLDAGDVRGSTALERQFPLREACSLARFPQALTDGNRVVDVG